VGVSLCPSCPNLVSTWNVNFVLVIQQYQLGMALPWSENIIRAKATPRNYERRTLQIRGRIVGHMNPVPGTE
jgi:hypothetical protein